MYTTLIDAQTPACALAGLGSEGILVLDCGFDLTDPGAGRRQYEAGHLPGAAYVHLDDTLSGAKTGANGRHPLPDREALAAALAALGADADTQIVAYDNAGGMYAARLWWLLRWIGHDAVAVLDGGIGAWKAAGQPLSTQPPAARAPGGLSARAGRPRTLSYAQMREALATGDRVVLDARAPDRYRGENETLDKKGRPYPRRPQPVLPRYPDAEGASCRPTPCARFS